jgi:hypothetical protein
VLLNDIWKIVFVAGKVLFAECLISINVVGRCQEVFGLPYGCIEADLTSTRALGVVGDTRAFQPFCDCIYSTGAGGKSIGNLLSTPVLPKVCGLGT